MTLNLKIELLTVYNAKTIRASSRAMSKLVAKLIEDKDQQSINDIIDTLNIELLSAYALKSIMVILRPTVKHDSNCWQAFIKRVRDRVVHLTNEKDAQIIMSGYDIVKPISI